MWFDMIWHDISRCYTSDNKIYSTLNMHTNKTLIWYNNNILMYVFHLSLRSPETASRMPKKLGESPLNLRLDA